MKDLMSAKRDVPARGYRSRLLLMLCVMLVASLFLSTIPTAWTVVEASPPNQDETIPPPTPPRPPEKKKKAPGATPTPIVGNLGVPVEVRLGPGDGLFHLPLPNAGCVQINVHGMSAQLLFQIIPLDPMTLAAPPSECRRTTAAYTIKAWDSLTGQETFSVTPNYIHTVCYNDADLAAANGDPNRFVIARYDEVTQTWVKLEPSIVDVPNRHVVGTTGQTGWWALLACEAAPMLLPETGQAPDRTPFLAILAVLVAGSGLWLAWRVRKNPQHSNA